MVKDHIRKGICVCILCVCVFVCVYDWVTLLYNRNWHNIVNQLYFNKKQFKNENALLSLSLHFELGSITCQDVKSSLYLPQILCLILLETYISFLKIHSVH